MLHTSARKRGTRGQGPMWGHSQRNILLPYVCKKAWYVGLYGNVPTLYLSQFHIIVNPVHSVAYLFCWVGWGGVGCILDSLMWDAVINIQAGWGFHCTC